ncbi:hypothetical protein Ddye_007252 [Dipteronia dyeriana]|uniref:Uncharacterized protein n=1 Tax=Dipteronia dyeriana TaxID=168575 RepID=A0AAD9XJK5_9ROSI|nr:hypothetical protein Ddye_007252 [Dipteronia dyeriana]
MAISKALIASLILSLLVLLLVEADQMVSTNAESSYNPSPKIDCGDACKTRCQSSSRPNLCVEAAVASATVFLRAPPVTTRPVPAMPP